MSIPYADLDPGVRDLVRWLTGRGFHTTDSGDGRTKPEEFRTIPGLHVVMTEEPILLVARAGILHTYIPYLLTLVDVGGLVVEASYRPADGVGVLVLMEGE